MQNETFRKLVNSTSYKLPPTNKYDLEDRYFTTTNELIVVNNNNRPDNYYYKYATGIKTGFTTPAGECIVASSNKDNFELISVVLGASRPGDGLSQRYLDTLSLFDYGYGTYTIREVAKQGQSMQTITVNNATRDTKRLEAVLPEDVSLLIKKQDLQNNILPDIKINDNLKAPIKEGDVIGNITYNVEDISYTYNLVAKSDVESSKIFWSFLEICFVAFILFVYVKFRKTGQKKLKK